MKLACLSLLLTALVASVSCSAAPNGGYHMKPSVKRSGGLTNSQTINFINEGRAQRGVY